MNGRLAHNHKQNSSNEVTLSRIKSNINFLVIRIDQVFLTDKSALINELISNGELFGFKLMYKVPNASAANLSLNKEVVANALKFSATDTLFKHKKVFSLELNNELIQKWDSSSLQISFAMICARSSYLTKEHSFMKHLCRGNISLSELLAPPFMISRDIDLGGVDVTASLSVSIELGSRQQRTTELLSELRKSVLENTFSVSRRREGGSRTRSRSSSRCRSCSTGENSPQYITPAPTPMVPMSPRKANFDRFPLQPVVPHVVPRSTYHHHPVVLPPEPAPTRLMLNSDDNDSVFEPSQPTDRRVHSRTGSMSERRGAVNLRLILHRATNLPLVTDQCGNYVPPRALASILARDETVMSSIAPPNRNPSWEWSGDFVFSLERGNLLVKLFHNSERGGLEALGLVTINAPLRSFDYREFEVLNAAPNHANNNATVLMSLIVNRRPPSVTASHGSYDKLSNSRSLAGSSNSVRSFEDNNGLLRWTGTAASPHLELRTRRARSISRSSTVETPILRTDTSNQLEGHLRELDRIMRRLN